jgi:ornithine cyclodeaminase
MEGSIISTKRTAASAALAARALNGKTMIESVGVIGCGLINLEIQRFLLSQFPSISKLHLFDLRADRAARFKRACRERFPHVGVEVAPSVERVLRSAPLISLATTATRPYITDLSGLSAGGTVLNISLRDLAPEVILGCDNIVDDIDHACRAQTSVHLAEQLSGTRDFVRCALAEITSGRVPARRDEGSVAVFSPFGLGVLDVAVGEFVYRRAIREGKGKQIDSFFPGARLSAPPRPPARAAHAPRRKPPDPDRAPSTEVA